MKKLWNIELNDQKNITLAFTYKTTTTTFLQLNLAASNEYQIFCNKKFIAYGPMRSAHGFSNLRSYQLFPNKQKCINLVIFVCGSQINSYDRINEQPFFSAEIFMNSKLIATSFDFKAFLINDRIQKVQRYSFQRTFTESYHYSQNRKNLLYGKSHNYPSVSLKEVASNNILNNCFLSEPDYHFIKSKIFECGYAYINSGKKTYRDRSLTGEGCNKNYLIFREEELYENLSSEAGKIDCIPANIPIDVLNKNNYILYELKRNSSGFFSFNINVLQKTTLYVLFDEILSNNKENKIDINRLQCCNAIKYVFDKGYYPVITFSPYTAKYISLVIIDGQAKINHFGMISYENPDDHLNISCHDAEIKKIIDAARATFRQNAVDILTDCPSRERAGWLCDSFFTARAEKFITGDNLVEKNFLRSYLLAPNFISAPGIIPMCYPADHVDGTYIPNWAMWFIIELKDYLSRTNDIDFIMQCKDKVYNIISFLDNYLNNIGLLENLESWVFIEWSKANDFTQGVNFPSNMLYALSLKCASELYNDKKLLIRYQQMKKTITTLSYNGKFFVDQAIRKNNQLTILNNISETCQYYAFWTGIATPSTHSDLYQRIKYSFSKNFEKDYPNVYPSNAFIGKLLRLDYLLQQKEYLLVLREAKSYYLPMAKRTGTLWENLSPTVSCNHGFSSYLTNLLISAYKALYPNQ